MTWQIQGLLTHFLAAPYNKGSLDLLLLLLGERQPSSSRHPQEIHFSERVKTYERPRYCRFRFRPTRNSTSPAGLDRFALCPGYTLLT